MAEVPAARQIEQIKDAQHHLLVALKYTPDEKLDWMPMGKAKTPREIAVECAMMEKGAASLIEGGTIDAPAQGLKPEGHATREGLLKLLDESLQELVSTAEGLTEERLEEERRVPWGADTVAGLLEKVHFHTIWHVGQLNYIQTLWSDTDMHWE